MSVGSYIMHSSVKVLVAVTVTLAALTAGCRSINRAITESVLDRQPAEEWHVRYGSRVQYVLNDETMKDVEFEGSANAGDTTVRYQRGLAQQAQCVADRTAELLRRVEEQVGVTITTRSTIHLLRFDQRPQDFDIYLKVEPNEFPLPLFIRMGEESCESILVQNRGYPYLFVHELVETSIASGNKRGVVLPDLSWGPPGLEVHISNYTRWFRDGLANYAGYAAYKLLAEEIPISHRLQYRQTLLHTNPFSSLAWVGKRLFSWRQSSRTRHERDYYNAALGLFLLIEDTYGQEAIRRIMAQIATREAVDGRDLLQITDQVLGVDVKRLAEDFEFPEVGVELERLTPAGALNSGLEVQEGLFVQTVEEDSAAALAGLQKRDAITAVGDAAVANALDFELALFQVRNQPSVPLTVQRRDAGTLTLQLPLQKPAAQPPGKRRKPPGDDAIESAGSPLLFTW
ncbi:MAG: hypothetical protein A2Y76_14945 [Planctomycetes bacterium RBG_13_60_9]|nr:MAG: hypothetical protein A2Y76_14945 [Planctomycetes bacterium RBG_13_60_9]